MRLGDTHLSYCTNVHAGATWEEAFAALALHVPAVRDALGPEPGERPPPYDAPRPFGLGLRLSHAHLVALENEAAFERFVTWLADERLYVFTINGFPYGEFHGTSVKSEVYRPDWTEPERLDYTRRLATLAARLGPPDGRMTISTLPGTFAAWGEGAAPVIAANLLDAVAHCVQVKRDSGVSVGIAIEPEPCCLFETVEQLVDFFAARLHSSEAVARVADATGSSTRAARAAIDEHLGACHDVCHSAVEFEDPLEAIARLRAGGVPIMKLQLSSALRLALADDTALAELRRFDEPVYLHQVVARASDGALSRHADLPDAIAARAARAADAGDEEWRVHFHVPVFLESMQHFGTTRFVLEAVLEEQRVRSIAPHLEVETYTWDVLPARYRDVAISTAIARELDWVRDRLRGPVGERCADGDGTRWAA